MEKLAVVLSMLSWSSYLVAGYNNVTKHSATPFPKDFKFGVSTSAYQIEGAWVEDGKGMSIWDYMVHVGSIITADGSNADEAADSYHLYKRDVELLRELGVDCYKFTISWPRILPNGLPTYVNSKGIAYYNALIDELLAKGIEPVVGMYHWDLPQNLQDKGGLLNDDFPKWFADYARILYQHFGDRVKNWITINEPLIQCHFSYGLARLAPKIYLPGTGVYDCNRNYLLAHAKAWHIYDDEFRAVQKGNVSANAYADMPYPNTNSTDDAEAVNDYMAFRVGLFLDPIHTKTGNYPQRVIDRVASLSAQQGFNSSRLKPLTDEEIKYIRGTSDFLTVNHYSSAMIYRNATVFERNHDIPSYYWDYNFGEYKNPEWKRADSPLEIWEYAPGMYNILTYMRDTYDNPDIYIIENGFITNGDDYYEDLRIDCIRKYLDAVKNAIEDGVRVKGYFYWSLFDNSEWAYGYSVKYGLYEMNHTDPAKTRTPRKSAYAYKDIIKSKVIDYDYNPSVSKSCGTLVRQSLVSIVVSVFCILYFFKKSS